MKIGIDLDQCVYGFPEFFAVFIRAMTDHGCQFYCTSNHERHEWEADKVKLQQFGIDHNMISPELLAEKVFVGGGRANKARMSDYVDINFDDAADLFQSMTKSPVFKTPAEKARDW